MISSSTRVFVALTLAGAGLFGAAVASAQTADTTVPRLTTVTMTTSASITHKAWVFKGDSIKLAFTASETIQSPTVTINGKPASVSGSGNKWTASRFLDNETEGPLTFSIAFKDRAGNSGVTVTKLTTGTVPTFMTTPSPSYCLYAPHFDQSPITFNSGGYNRIWVEDSKCPPKAVLATFSATVGAEGSQSTLTVTAKSNDKISIQKDCGFLGFGCEREIKVRPGTSTSTSGSLPAFIAPGEPITLSWQCQPYQSMLWIGGDYDFWGWFGDDLSDSAERFFYNYSTAPVGVGFNTGGKFKGSVVVNPTQTTKYKINCGSRYYQFPEIEIKIDNPQGTITASPSAVRPGGTATVFWSATNVKDNSCTVRDNSGRTVGTPNTNAGPAGGVRSGALTTAMSPVTFTLTCERYGGQQVVFTSNPVVIASTCVTNFNSNNLQQCSFNSSSPVNEGGAVNLRWYCPSSNQTYRIESSTDGGTNWSNVTSGTVPSGNDRERTQTISNGQGPLNDTQYRLTCVSTAGNSVGTANTVVSHPDLTIKADPAALDLGLLTISRITWSARNVNSNSCSMTGDGLTAVIRGNNNSRGVSVTPTSLPANYTLTCETPASAANRTNDPTKTATINMVGMEPTITRIWIEPAQVRKGEGTLLKWAGENLPGSCDIAYNPAIPAAPSSGNSTATGNTIGVDVRPVSQRTEITLNCGGTTASVTAGLIPEFQEI